MNLDIRSAVVVATALAGLAAIFSLITGIRSIVKARNLQFFRMRRNRMVRGWRLVLAALIWGMLAFLVNAFAEPVAYSFFPPSITPTLSPTVTLTPTISPTPSITLTPTITETPSETDTPTVTPTPHIPLAIEAQFEGEMTPPANAVLSNLAFTSQGLDALYRPLEPGEVFTNPISSMYAVFTYDGMVDGIQWTALWFRNGELVNFETKPWDGGTGGTGYTDWAPDIAEWLPGLYEVQIFLGLDWLRLGFFSVVGDPPEPTVTPTPTPTDTPTPTITYTPSPVPTATATPSRTPWPTLTRTGTSPPPTATSTRTPTPTKTQSSTPAPTATRTPSRTPYPTLTRTVTPIPMTPSPTLSPTLTPTKRIFPTAFPPTPSLTRRPLATPITPSPTITRWPTATRMTPTPTTTFYPTPSP